MISSKIILKIILKCIQTECDKNTANINEDYSKYLKHLCKLEHLI